MGAVGAVLAIPGAAMIQALLSDMGERHEVVDDRLTTVDPRRLPSSTDNGESGDTVHGTS
jgi:hypothetical protein